MRMKNFKKFIKSTIMIFLVILLITLIIDNKTLSHKEIEYKEIYVSQGDTLWNIAKENQESNTYYENKDIRYILDDLMKVNHLKNGNIKINQKILIPIG